MTLTDCLSQLSFIEQPSLDFSVSSLGGVELSAIPVAFYWMNTTLHWVLRQYTAPLSVSLDLRHTVCPDCDAPPLASLREVVSSALKRGSNAAADGVVVLRRFVERRAKSLLLGIKAATSHSRKVSVAAGRWSEDALDWWERLQIASKVIAFGEKVAERARSSVTGESSANATAATSTGSATQQPTKLLAALLSRTKRAARLLAADLLVEEADLELALL